MIFITGQKAPEPQSERGEHTHIHTHLWGPPKERSHSKRLTSEKEGSLLARWSAL